MKIGINAIGLKSAAAGGVEIYFRNLIRAICEFDKKNEYYVFLSDKKIKRALQPYINSRVELIYFSLLYTDVYKFYAKLSLLFTQPRIFYRLLVNKFYRTLFFRNIYELDPSEVSGKITNLLNLDRFKISVIHFPFTTIDPYFFYLKTPIALTIHDIQQEYHPEFFDSKTLNWRKKCYRPSAERADVIITISEAVKKTLIEKYGIKPEKVIVTYQGCSKKFRKIKAPKTLSAVREKYDLPGEFMFYPASTWPHKNHIKLLEALLILKRKFSFEKNLILTGIPMNRHSRFMDDVERLNLGSQVKFLGFVPFDDLPVIYNLATIMVFPSLFEGFGIPLVEAMRVGLPITCSDRTSIPEIVGEAGLYFNPDSAEDIAEKVYQLWHNDNLKEKLAKKGFEQARKFTWKQVTEKTVVAYKYAEKT